MPRFARVAGLCLMVCCVAAGRGSLLARPAAVDAADDVKAADSIIYQAIASRDGNRLAGLLDDGFVLTNTFGDVYDKAKFLQACCTGESASKTLLCSIRRLINHRCGGVPVLTRKARAKWAADTPHSPAIRASGISPSRFARMSAFAVRSCHGANPLR